MNKNIKTTKLDENITAGAIENISNVELDNVTGGCSSCGCGQPDPAAAQQQQQQLQQRTAPSTWLRR